MVGGHLPALFIRMSSLSLRDLKSAAALATALRSPRSSWRNSILASGVSRLISSIAACAFDAVRAARKTFFGLCRTK